MHPREEMLMGGRHSLAGNQARFQSSQPGAGTKEFLKKRVNFFKKFQLWEQILELLLQYYI